MWVLHMEVLFHSFVFQAKKKLRLGFLIFFYVSWLVKEESSEPTGLTLSSGTSGRHKSQINNENNEDLELWQYWLNLTVNLLNVFSPQTRRIKSVSYLNCPLWCQWSAFCLCYYEVSNLNLKLCVRRNEMRQLTLQKQHLEETIKHLRACCSNLEEQCVQHGRMHQRMKTR